MAVADPTTLTLIRGSTALVRINQDKFASTFRFNDATSKVEMNVRHSSATREGVIYDRHNIEVVETIYATSTVPQLTRKCYLVFEQPSSDTSIVNVTGLLSGLTASTNALLTKIMNWES
jgi:hypothetical protein